ncbi:dihydrofolate reductase [Clostridium botulinum]|uniref:Dihydrofolate reductase n=1 Tax=Clostridium botulinum TaxID=1491 RepID=A0A6G4CLV1_CLOBO|nr:dihydrofolate reductase [Clostridium botulinum]NEZ99499.1 dihydrofolate reductase [Clostridium botulinum]NFA30976.1 dihydrofolate reductase [Clostridium botulinum]NFA84436.1 dihydrofolate reductase [Clostridium botulinum]NFB05196.1 dihydrofolate reductase [Clostridium botulinum]
MEFNKIVCIDKTGLEPWAIEELKKYSIKPIELFDDHPENDNEIINRIKYADCVLVSWNTQISKKVIESCKQLKYIGMCCSLYDENSANIDIKIARVNNIEVRGVRDYGDEGLIEFIISELIRLLKGLGEHQWRNEAVELTQRKIGIIGMGTTGRMLARMAFAFGMKIYYFSRSRKMDIEKEGIEYLPLNELLKTVEIISIHLPKNTVILGKDEFDLFGDGKILINTSLGTPFEVPAFLEWIQKKGNYAIYDEDGAGSYKNEFEEYSNVILSKKVAGWTKEARERLSIKVLKNIEEVLNELNVQ